MGVMGCSVRDCDRIMCDRYNSSYGYICNRCFERLVSKGVKTDIKQFFNTPPSEENDEEATEAYFNALFPSN